MIIYEICGQVPSLYKHNVTKELKTLYMVNKSESLIGSLPTSYTIDRVHKSWSIFFDLESAYEAYDSVLKSKIKTCNSSIDDMCQEISSLIEEIESEEREIEKYRAMRRK